MLRRLIALMCILLIAAIITPVAPVFAQQPDPLGSASCAAIYDAAMVDMMANCFGKPTETVCVASGSGQIEMASGQVIDNGPGSAARLSGVSAVRTLPGESSAWSLANFSVPDMLDAQKAAMMLVIGPAELTFDTASGLPLGTAFNLSNADAPFPCEGLPHPGVLVQTAEDSLLLVRVNGTDLAINGMALIWSLDDNSLMVLSLTRETILGQTGTVVFAGYMVRALADAVSEVVPYDWAAVRNLPTEILPTMDVIGVPGNATVRERINIHTRPDPANYTNFMVAAGLPVTVLGTNSAGDWLHVRTYEGVVGWMPTYYLTINVPGDVQIPVYDEAPPPPIRPFGSIQGYVKTNAEYNNLRAGPAASYDIVVTVPLWTDLALYGRSLDDEWLLVETLDGERGWIATFLISNSTPYTLSELPYPPEMGG